MTQQATSSDTMICSTCNTACKRFGKHRNGLQRFRCRKCGKTFTEEHERPFRIEDYLNDSRGVMAVQLLVEGCSIRTAERITGLHRDAIVKLLLVAGERCEIISDALIRNVPAEDVQADEIWGFIAKKEGHKRAGGSARRYHRRLLHLGCHRAQHEARARVRGGAAHRAQRFRVDAESSAGNIAGLPFQLTTDGLTSYIAAVDEMLLDCCDYAQLVKSIRFRVKANNATRPRKSRKPSQWSLAATRTPTRFARPTLSDRTSPCAMQIRRLTRLTNGFSKKLRTTARQSRCTSRITISAGFTRPCALPPRWNRESPIMSGACRNCWPLPLRCLFQPPLKIAESPKHERFCGLKKY